MPIDAPTASEMETLCCTIARCGMPPARIALTDRIEPIRAGRAPPQCGLAFGA